MSLYITETPLKTLNEDIPEESKWSAVWHPVMWKFLRKDCIVSAITYGGGSPEGIDITVTGDFTDEVEAGQTVYAEASDGNISGNYTVLDVSLSGGDTIITIEADDLGSYTANGYVNLVSARTFYKIEIAIYGYKNGVSELINDDYAQFSPNTDGSIRADIQSWLQAEISPLDTFTYQNRSQEARQLGTRYDLQVREYWKEDGYGTWNETTDLDGGDLSEHYYSHSVKQIAEFYGQNMAEFVMFPTNQDSPQIEHSKGKFLTMFEMPTYFQGYPFSLSFIYSKDITDAGQRVSIVEDSYDVQGNLLGSTDDLIDDTSETVTRCTLKSIFDDTPYSDAVKTIDIYLKAKTISAQADATSQWNVSVTGSSRIEIIDIDSNVTLGNAQWDTDLETTLTNLANSLNTNTQDGATINGVPFDNSQGYTCAITDTGGGTFDVVITAPVGSGASYNGVTLWFAVDSGTWVINPFVAPGYDVMSGGDDGLPVDADGLTTARISEIKTIEIKPDCYVNPVMLKWLTPYGGYDYWVFEKRQVYKDKISGEKTFERYIEDLGSTTARAEVMSKDVQGEILLGAAGLSKQQKEGLRYLLRSTQVYLLTDADNLYWQTVGVGGGTFDIDTTDETKEEIELNILLPEFYNQQQ